MTTFENIKKLIFATQSLTAARSIEDIAMVVRSSARGIVKADGVTFVMREGRYCHYLDEEAIGPLWKGQKFILETCISGWSMIHKEQVFIENIYEDDRIPINAYRPTFVHSLAMSPIRQTDPIGAIGFYWKNNYTPNTEEKELMQILADSAALAIENLNLYNSLEKRIVELARSNQEKEEFLLNASHELKTPINAINNWVQLIRTDDCSKEDLNTALIVIEKCVKNQTRIIDDLLDSAKIVMNKVQVELVSMDVTSCLRDTIELFSIELQKKNITLKTRIQEKQDFYILGDRTRFQQILNNLISNAIKFSSSGSSIEITLFIEGPNVVLSVSDQGIGIGDKFLSEIFNRFKQEDASMKRRHGGLGIGLSIAQYLAHAHQGRIEVFSAGEGKGSTFTVTIPHANSLIKDNAQSKINKALEGINILIVDDDSDARLPVELFLKKNGATIYSANSVEEALNQINNKNKIDLVLTDLSMPDEDGFSFTAKVREGKTELGPATPIIALTAFTDTGTKENAVSKGFNLFFGKPFSAPVLVSSILGLVGYK